MALHIRKSFKFGAIFTLEYPQAVAGAVCTYYESFGESSVQCFLQHQIVTGFDGVHTLIKTTTLLDCKESIKP